MEFILGMVLMFLILAVVAGCVALTEEQKAKQYARRHRWQPLPASQYFKVYDSKVKVETRAQGSKHLPVMHLSSTDILELPEVTTKREVMQLSDWLMGYALSMVPQGQPITREVIQDIYTRAPRPTHLSAAATPPAPAANEKADNPANDPPSANTPSSGEYRRMLKGRGGK